MNAQVLSKAIEISLVFHNKFKQRYNLFSFIYRKNQIYSFGYNDMSKTHTVAYYNNYKYPYIHSELASILAFKDIDNAHRYHMLNIRLGKSGKLRNSMPCNNCMDLINKHNFKSITYSTDKGFTCQKNNH